MLFPSSAGTLPSAVRNGSGGSADDRAVAFSCSFRASNGPGSSPMPFITRPAKFIALNVNGLRIVVLDVVMEWDVRTTEHRNS